MIINMAGRGTTIQDSFKDLVETKLQRFDRFFGENAVANVTITNEGHRETVEVTIHADGMVFRSERTTDDRRDSLDSVVDTLFRQIVRNKERLRDQLRRNAFDMDFESVFEDELEELGEPFEDEYRIVRSKQFDLKPMLVEEAILQMNMLGHNFFMFMNAETDDIGVVYKRDDGNYGLIEQA